MDLLPRISAFVNHPMFWDVVRAVIILIVGGAVAKAAGSAIRRFSLRRQIEAQREALARRAVFYTMLVLAFLAALHQLGVNLSVLLGTAGILSVAIGFASQTSASNIISGLFLIGEKAFVIGDVIQVGTETGEVISIDLLSVKLRTYDNLYVRVPNETLIKSNVINLTRFPIRRYDMQVGVAYKEDLARVHAVLEELADRNPLCLTEPKPLFIFLGFGDSSVNLQFSVWARREKYLDLRNTLSLEVKNAFDEAGIEIPFPHRSLYTGSATEPFPVRVVSQPGADTPAN